MLNSMAIALIDSALRNGESKYVAARIASKDSGCMFYHCFRYACTGKI